MQCITVFNPDVLAKPTFDGQEVWENQKNTSSEIFMRCNHSKLGTDFLFLVNLNIFLLFF